ncbi:hypothetical protein J512_4194 [Acinetobacter baumannii 1295743]|uniref:Uncharacterized protein n=1 Tax=Acinetobacter baumannii (strain 1295743) TaxID=1310613 RepID=A0A009IHE0_ACIB9|nr:hypothetical protein J512_4194 [Acinetobacter baumannii 1295743]
MLVIFLVLTHHRLSREFGPYLPTPLIFKGLATVLWYH